MGQVGKEAIVGEHTTIVTRKGQITVPVAVRRALNLKEGDRVVVTLKRTYDQPKPLICDGLTEIISFDHHFDRNPGIRCTEPWRVRME